MPCLRLDAHPPVSEAELPEAVAREWVAGPDGKMRRRVDNAAPAAKSHRAEAAAQPAAPQPSTALVVAGGAGGASSSRALTVNQAAVAASEAAVAKLQKAKSSSAAEMAAFNAAFTRAKPTKLFQKSPVPAESEGGVPVAPASDDRSPAEAKKAPDTAKGPARAPSPVVELDPAVDHLGRGFIHCSTEAARGGARRAAPPTKLVHVFRGHSAGVQALAWFPGTAHLLLSCDLQGEVMLWDVLGHRRRVARYHGHDAPVRSISFAADGLKLSTSCANGFVREWDTETGQVINTFASRGNVAIGQHAYHPAATRMHSIFVGAGNAVTQYDTRAAPTTVARDYEAHNEPVIHLGFLDNHHFATTSEDKTMRTWDVDSSVTVQDFAGAARHASPHFAVCPATGKIAAQGLDNKVRFFTPLKSPGKYREVADRVCSGHSVSGSSCKVAFSPDGQFVSSGDVKGELHVWNAETTEPVKHFRAHSKPLNAHLWHPTDMAKVVTAGWDGAIKMFVAA
uniref:Guanine nucleotide-binding protein subunit beta-like protein n=1 Tax=Neobodo designis TaxID=312471 RepID=A0A7S1Q6E5_NEODS